MPKYELPLDLFFRIRTSLDRGLMMADKAIQMLPTDSPQRNWYQVWQQEIRQSAAELNDAENWSLQSAIRWR